VQYESRKADNNVHFDISDYKEIINDKEEFKIILLM